MKIIISGGGTGGHIYPAIAIANALKSRAPGVDILFVGAEGRMEMEKVPAEGYAIVGLPVAGLQRKLTWKNLLLPYKLWKSVRKAAQIINQFKPDVVVGVGGYASAPVLWTAQRKNIPTVIQEQNSYAGITNKLLAKRAAKICVAYDGMERFFPKEKIVLTGNPVRFTANGQRPTANGERPTESRLPFTVNPSPFTVNPSLCTVNPSLCTVNPSLCTVNPSLCTVNPSLCTVNPSLCTVNPSLCTVNPSPFTVRRSPFTVLLVGGSLGARTLNQAMMQALPDLRDCGVHFIWQTGKSYFEQAKAAVDGERPTANGQRRTENGQRRTENGERPTESRLPLTVNPSPMTPLTVNPSPCTVVDFISRMDEAFAAADVVVSRAGAGTISELCVAAKACVLVPSPNVAEDHQTKNAQALVDKNAAIMVRDDEAKEKLIPTVLALLQDKARIRELERNIAALAKPNAANEIAEIIIGQRKTENG